MIRITKPGRTDAKWVGTCSYCNCEVECDEYDPRVSFTAVRYVDCPCCKLRNISMLPKHDKSALNHLPIPPEGGSGAVHSSLAFEE